MGCYLIGSQSPFQSRVTHTRGKQRSRRQCTYLSFRMVGVCSSGGGIVRCCKRIERILNRNANARKTYPKWMSCIRKYVRRKRRRHKSAIPERAHVFEISKKLQILAADFSVERAVEVFTVNRGHCWRESGVVK